MSTTSAASAPATGPLRLLTWTLVLALIGGAALDGLTVLVADLGPSADGWSLRGNGALVIPFGLGPAVLGGGWTALALHGGRNPLWAVLGATAGLVGAALALAQVAYLAVFGQPGADVFGAVTLVALAVWVAGVPAVIALRTRGDRDRPIWHLMAAGVLLAGLVAGFAATSVVLPPG